MEKPSFSDEHLTFYCSDYAGNPLPPMAVTITAEEKRERWEFDEWIRECWYAGIIDQPLPAAPSWYRPIKRITGIRFAA